MLNRTVLALVGTMLLSTAAQAVDKPAKTQITWWGHAAWVIKTPAGTTIAIDPWLTNPKAPQGMAQPDALDAILVTHAHSDHVGNTIDLAKKTNAKVVACYELTGLLGLPKEQLLGGNPGGTVKIKDDVTIHYVEAVHSSGYGDGSTPLQYGGAPMGFVIEIANGPTLYHAGDTDVFMDMSLIHDRYNPTIAMLPIGGHYTMDPKGAALAAKLLKVKTVIPMHFGTFPALTGTPDELRAALKKTSPSTKVLEFTPGETKEL